MNRWCSATSIRCSGIVFVSALLVISVNFVVDLIYARLDPRITAG